MDKKATQQDLTNLFEEFGQIESINVSITSYTVVYIEDFHAYKDSLWFVISQIVSFLILHIFTKIIWL